MKDNMNTESRVAIVEHSVHKLEAQVTHGFAEVNTALRKHAEATNHAIADLSKVLAARRDPIPFKEIIITAGATFGLVMSILTFLDNRAAMQSQLATYRIEQIEKRLMPTVTLRTQ